MALEDLTSGDYTLENSDGSLSRTSSRVTATGIRRDDNDYLVRDFGEGAFGEDWTHRFELYITSVENTSIAYFNDLDSRLGDQTNRTGAGSTLLSYFAILENSAGVDYITIENGISGQISNDSWAYTDSPAPATGTLYYVEQIYTKSTGIYITTFKTGGYSGTLRKTLTVDTDSAENVFRYYYPVSARGQAPTSAPAMSFYIQNIDLGLSSGMARPKVNGRNGLVNGGLVAA
jgi:hypothetical protein